jgi:TonB-linked SusC/RagA family outer membrane protein
MKPTRVLSAGVALLSMLAVRLVAQEVAGTVVDARTGRPVDGVQVTVQGTSVSARSDGRGRFRLAGVSGEGVTLVMVRIGYRSRTAEARVGDVNLRIELTEQALNLGEIVVTGTAGGQEKRTLGNSITTVRAAEMQELAPAPDLSGLINARAPGVVVIPGTGQVGSGPRIRIRGRNSFSLSDQPLIYIDGVRVVNDVATGIVVQAFGSGVVSRLNDIDPNLIDRIEVIKGPSAATLYGTEASNGVIQIFTKRGVAGDKPKVSLSIRQGTQWFMNPEGRIRQPVGRVCPFPQPVDPTTCPVVAWNPVRQEDSLSKAGVVSRPLFTNGYGMGYGLDISGGSGTVRYFAGASFDKDKGIEPTNNQRKFAANLNVTVTPAESYDIQASLGIVKSKLNQAFEAGAGGVWFSTIFGDPALVRDSLGNLTARRGFLFGPPEYQWGSRQASQVVDRYTASVTINHRPRPWFSQRLTLGQDQTDEASLQLNRFLPPEWVQFNPGTGALGGKFDQRRAVSYLTFDYNGSVKLKLNKRIASTSTLGAQYYRRQVDLVNATGNQFPAPGLETILATAQTFGVDDYVTNSTLGVFVQQQFSFRDKLYVTGAVRVDNNSAFGPNFDLVAYPKVSASYVLAEGGSGTVNALKLRAAYGQSGQQPQSFAALRSYQPVTGGDGGPAVIPQSIGNPDLAPERATEVETGFEGGFLNDRIATDFSFYYKKTRDAILEKRLAPSIGFPATQFLNVGAIRNQGFEAQISASPVEGKKVGVRADFNLSYNENKVLELFSGVDSLGAFGPKVGYPVDAIFVKKVISADYDPVTKRAINVLCAGGPDGKTGVSCTSSAAGGVYLGVWDPRWEGSFSSTVTLLGRLRLYGLVDFKLGNRHFDNNLRALCQVFLRCDENFNPQNYDILKIAEIQANNVPQSWVINKASFAKLREVSASYTFPRRLARWFGGQNAVLTLSARNLHTWTGWTGLDPEAYFVSNLFTRLEQDGTPQLASFMATLNITF